MGTLAAAKHQERGPMVRFQCRHAEELRTDRHANHPGVAKIAARLLKVYSSRRNPSAYDLVGKSRHIIRFEGQRRNAPQNGGHHGRPRSIPAYSYYHLWTEDLDNFARMKNGQWKIKQGPQS